MIYIIGITLAFFLEFLLLSKKDKINADIILAVWLFFIGLHLFLYYIHYSGLTEKYPISIGFIFPLPLVHGPFLYLYTSSLTNQLPQRKFLQFIHFAPPFLMYLYMIHFFILPAEEKIKIVSSGGGVDYHVFNIIRWILTMISGVVYVAWAQILLIRHRKNIKEQFANVEKIDLNWLQYVIIGIGFIWAVILFFNLLVVGLLGIKGINADIYIYISVVFFVIFLGYFGLKQTNTFVTQSIKIQQFNSFEPSSNTENKEFEKYAKSGLKDTDAEILHKKLHEYMEIEKPYLNDNLSLSKLAEVFDVHPNYLSQVINEREKKNLFDYINGYRIEEFKQMLSDPKKKNFTILALAYDCGFNSKSAFNSFFKKATGQTPSEYIKLKK